VSWAAYAGTLRLAGTPLAFLSSRITAWIFTVLALFELVVIDQRPTTPSRRTPAPFAARIVSGALCGTAVGLTAGSWAIGLVLGILGAILGTLAGYDARTRLAHAFHRDQPAGVLEDAVAIAGAVLIVAVLA
jgi:uncharacterized membrane protein